MKLIANGINSEFLTSILPPDGTEVDGVLAAVAYGSNPNNEKNDFVGHSLRNRYRVDIWMRYDHTVPVSIPLLRRLLRHHRDNIFCRLIPDCFHSKVIWWKGYGVYIGSANLSERAWFTNIEAGLFLSESDLQNDGMNVELEKFFDGLRELDVAFPLTEEVIRELEKIDEQRRNVDQKGSELRTIPVWQGLAFEEKTKAVDRGKENFRREWHETLSTMRTIGEQLEEYRPKWITADVPIAWQIDQFLHAYYYNKVVGDDALSKPFWSFHVKNKPDPSAAVTEAMRWWKSTEYAPSNEEVTLYENAPLIRARLSKENILKLNEQQFADVCGRTHATRDHVIKMSLAVLGHPDIKSLSRDERIPLYAAWLFQKRNEKGWSILELLNYVLYGGNDNELWSRLYSAVRDPNYSLPHYGLNTIAELVGWARPEVAPPRNGRTSKALTALGFDVRIY